MLQGMLSLFGIAIIVGIIGVINAIMKWTDKDKSDEWKQDHY